MNIGTSHRWTIQFKGVQPDRSARDRYREASDLVFAALGALGGWLHLGDAAVVQVAPQGLAHPLHAFDDHAVGGVGAEAQAALVVGVVHGPRRQLRERVLDLRRLVLQARPPVPAAQVKGQRKC